MASNAPGDDFELAYLRRQRATNTAIFEAQQKKLEADQEIDRKEYEFLLSKKQTASAIAVAPLRKPVRRAKVAAVASKPRKAPDLTSSGPGPGFPPAHSPEPKIKQEGGDQKHVSLGEWTINETVGPPRRTINSVGVSNITPSSVITRAGDFIDLSTPESDASFPRTVKAPTTSTQKKGAETELYHTQQTAAQGDPNGGRLKRGAGRPSKSLPKTLAQTAKRKRADDHVSEEEDLPTKIVPSRRREASIRRRTVHNSFLTVATTPDGSLAEYRCRESGCGANGFKKNGVFNFFKGVAGLSKHITNNISHQNLTEAEVSVQCIYHKLDEHETAMIMRGDTEAYGIEQVSTDNISNRHHSRGLLPEHEPPPVAQQILRRFGYQVMRQDPQGSTMVPEMATQEADTNSAVELDAETAAFQASRREHSAKKMEDTATVEEDETFHQLEKGEKTRLDELRGSMYQGDVKSSIMMMDDKSGPRDEIDHTVDHPKWW